MLCSPQQIVCSAQGNDSREYTVYEIGFETPNCELFSTILQACLISECRACYLALQGFENWRQIKRGKIPGKEKNLISALEEYNRKADLAGTEDGHYMGNPVSTLWELKCMAFHV